MTNIKVLSLKKQAKLKRKNNNSIKNHNDSLNIIAKENGYKNWQDLLNSAEIKVKSKLPNYVFLSKKELEAISTEELKKHESNIRKQYNDSLKEYQTIELIKLNETALNYLKELFKNINNISEEDWESALESIDSAKNVSFELSEQLKGSEKEYNLNDDIFNYTKEQKIKLKNKIKTEDDYSFYLYLKNSYKNKQVQIPEKLIHKSNIFCFSFIDLITTAKTNKILDIDLKNVNYFLNINCLENLLWEEKIVKELKTEMLLFLEDIGYKMKTPFDPSPKNAEKILNELNYYFNMLKLNYKH